MTAIPLILKKRPLQWCALVFLIFVVIFGRAPEVLLLPTLQADDGINVFSFFYQFREPEQVLRFKAGYMPLVANLIGYLSVRLPTRLIPYGMAWLPLFVTLAAYSAFFSVRYKPWFNSDALRAFVCFLFALAPLAQFHLLSHTDYSIWNTLLLLMLMSALPLPEAAWWKYPYWLVLNLLIWSHPLTILVLPFYLFFLYREKSDRALHCLTLLNIAAHQIYGVEGAGIFSALSLGGVAARAAESAMWAIVLLGKTAFRAAFGGPVFDWANTNMPPLIAAWSLLVAGTTLVVFIKARQSRMFLVGLFYLVFGLTFLSVFVRGYDEIRNLNDAPRYVYIQSLGFLALFVFIGDKLAGLAYLDKQPGTRRSLNWKRSALVVAAIYYGTMNIASNGPYRYAHAENGQIVRAFFETLDETEKRIGWRGGIYLSAEKKDDWPLIVDTTGWPKP